MHRRDLSLGSGDPSASPVPATDLPRHPGQLADSHGSPLTQLNGRSFQLMLGAHPLMGALGEGAPPGTSSAALEEGGALGRKLSKCFSNKQDNRAAQCLELILLISRPSVCVGHARAGVSVS